MGKAHKNCTNGKKNLSPPHYRNSVLHPVEIICVGHIVENILFH